MQNRFTFPNPPIDLTDRYDPVMPALLGLGLSVPATSILKETIDRLVREGHVVEQQDIPGLFRIDGGTELTINQMLSIYAPGHP